MRVVWGLRASTIELGHYDWLHRLASRAEKWCSRFADLIIINSHTGLEQHVARGFPRKRIVVIPNGFDTEVFKPDREAGAKQRREWRVQEQTQLVGIVGRLDPMKDHQNFFRAAALVSKKMNDVSLREGSAGNRGEVRFVCVGDGPANYLEGLKALANDLGIAERVIWQEATTAVAAVYNALDVLVSSSRAEGLSNAVGEAMACGVACVTTDVGDSRLLVGECGIVVPAQNSEALAEGIIRSLSGKQPELGNIARERIAANFSVQRLAQLTEEALVSVARE
jgi:glycosyltransferase involved in cell wall biosynthesis